MQYFIRRTGLTSYEVAKFDPNENLPKNIYTLGKADCDCPSYHRPCKHVKMVQEWCALGEHIGVIFDSGQGRFVDVGISLDRLAKRMGGKV